VLEQRFFPVFPLECLQRILKTLPNGEFHTQVKVQVVTPAQHREAVNRSREEKAASERLARLSYATKGIGSIASGPSGCTTNSTACRSGVIVGAA